MLGRWQAAPPAHPDWQSLGCQSEGPLEATCGFSRLRLVLQRLCSGAESCGGVLRGPTAPQYGPPTDVAGTLGSLVAAPGLMIVQKAAIKSLGGGERKRTEKHSSADPGTKES